MKKFFGVLLALVLAFSCVTLVACVDKKEETPSDVAVTVATVLAFSIRFPFKNMKTFEIGSRQNFKKCKFWL